MSDPRLWTVQASLPKQEGNHRSCRRNVSASVIASSARIALDAAEAKWPGCAVWSVHHLGAQTLIDTR